MSETIWEKQKRLLALASEIIKEDKDLSSFHEVFQRVVKEEKLSREDIRLMGFELMNEMSVATMDACMD